MLVEHRDVLIVGAGLSGIGAACLLRRRSPARRFLLLEARERIGGTWDLFRYPGMRSDSDMFTLGYSFRPWTGSRGLGDGAAILRYIRETADEYGLEREIRRQHRVVSASWSSAQQRWTVEVERERARDRVRFTCSFLLDCTGYFRYDQGHMPEFPDSSRFRGTMIHPQFWPDAFDASGKRIVVIGSGATAVTLIPALAARAASVTMLQRSPGYVLAQPTRERVLPLISRLPAGAAYRIRRWESVLFGFAFYQLCRRFPSTMRKLLLSRVQRALGPNYDVSTHFSPRYDPWQQRLCLAPDGDLFAAIREGRADICTGEVERLTPDGVRLRDGRDLGADVIVTATGLRLALLGDVRLEVDGRAATPAGAMSYRGAMYGGIPNFASTFGYTNASWTLRSELTCRYVCRLLNHMQQRGHRICLPVADESQLPEEWMNLTSGYIRRSAHLLSKQGLSPPWRRYQNYLLDLVLYYASPLDDGAMRFS